MAWSSGQGHLGTNHRGGLEQTLLLGRQPVDACRQHRLHRRRHVQGRQGLRQTIGPRLADQDPRLHQGAHALFQEERIALGAGDEQCREGHQTRVVSEQRLQERVRAYRGQGIEAQLGVVGLAAPAVLVLGPVVDQQQERAVGRLSTRLSSSACVSVSIQCRSSKTSSSGCTWLSRSSRRLRASRCTAALGWIEACQQRTVHRHGIQERQQGGTGSAGAPRRASALARRSWLAMVRAGRRGRPHAQ